MTKPRRIQQTFLVVSDPHTPPHSPPQPLNPHPCPLQSLALFRVSQSEGHFGQQQWGEAAPPPPRAEINLHAMTAGVAMLSLYCWLMRLQRMVRGDDAGPLPARLAIVTDKGKGSKEQGNLVVKEAVAAIMCLWQAPFRYAHHFQTKSRLALEGLEWRSRLESDGGMGF